MMLQRNSNRSVAEATTATAIAENENTPHSGMTMTLWTSAFKKNE